MSEGSTSVPIRILHLSDFHFSANKAWDADPVLRELATAIRREVATGMAPDFIAITGDLAFSGLSDEYKLFGDWLEQRLWSAIGDTLPRDRLLLVPGNHDVDRSCIKRGIRALQTDLLSSRSQDVIAEVLADPDESEPLLRRHQAYLQFVARWRGESQSEPWWQKTFTVRGHRLHFAGLDSAWMSCGDQDHGQLLLGRWQLNQLIGSEASEGADLRIALLHHPWSFLADFDGGDAEARVHQKCDLVLRGHLHQAKGVSIAPPDASRACLELAAGCAYESSEYANAYQWLELWPKTKNVKVHFRTWRDNQWMPDRNLPGCPNGVAKYPLGSLTDSEGQPDPFIPAADFGKFLSDLHQDTGHIDIRGLVTGTPQAHRFPIEDLYIELSSSDGEAHGRARGKTGADEPRGGSSQLYHALANPRQVIIGDPGAGKTTFLRWVAHILAEDRLGKRPGAARDALGLDRARLPLLIPIADWLAFRDALCRRNQGPPLDTASTWLLEYLTERAKAANQGLKRNDFQPMLEQGEALILLDGLDEAPDPRRRAEAVQLIEAVARGYPECPLVVTSRPAAYRDKAVLTGFSHTTIDPLDPSAIHTFLERWSQALFPNQTATADAHRQALQSALEARREIRRMARNTVMLTALAVVHWNEKRLPEQRAELYESIIKWLAEAREQRPGRLPAQRCRQLLGELALAMQRGGNDGDEDPGNDQGKDNSKRGRAVQIPRHQAAEWLAPHFPAPPNPAGADRDTGAGTSSVDRAEAFLAEEELDSGIVVRRGNQLQFWHLTFQEYLAAQAIAGRPEQQQQELLLGPELQLYAPEWRESVLLLGGVLYQQGIYKVEGLVGAILDQLELPTPGQRQRLPDQARCAGLLGALVRDLEPYGYHPRDPRYARVLDAAMAVFDRSQAKQIPITDRIAAADALAWAGDPRLGWLHPQRWVALPGGQFAMGAQQDDRKDLNYDQKAYSNEAPVHPVEISPFSIARFPVTVAEYTDFIEEGGYQQQQWWAAGGYGDNQQPKVWEPQQEYPSRPVTGVCWHEAAAYCAWLNARMGRPHGARGEIPCTEAQVIRLPTEAEWEYTARGTDGRRYPWGDKTPDRERTNFGETNIDAPSPVGVFPEGCTPDGVLDMAGNVGEWCQDRYDGGYYQRCREQGVAIDPTGGADAAVPRAMRGGAFGVYAKVLRATGRGRDRPEFRYQNFGFRCVLAPRHQP